VVAVSSTDRPSRASARTSEMRSSIQSSASCARSNRSSTSSPSNSRPVRCFRRRRRADSAGRERPRWRTLLAALAAVRAVYDARPIVGREEVADDITALVARAALVDPRGLAVDREPIRHVDRVPVERVAKPVSVVWFDDSEPVSLRQRVGVETRLTRGLDGNWVGSPSGRRYATPGRRSIGCVTPATPLL